MSPPITTASNEVENTRDQREQLPLWRIRGSIETKTPLSIGSGKAHDITVIEKDGKQTRYVIGVMRDQQGNPYLPASGIKGALLALAGQTDLDEAVITRLFGSITDDKTTASQCEFCNAQLEQAPSDSQLPNWEADGNAHTAHLPHVVINRDYGVAEDKLLYLEQVVPPDTTFEFEITARAVEEGDIAKLLGLLELASDNNSPLRLGGGKANNNGKIAWKLEEIRRFNGFRDLWQHLQNHSQPAISDLWSNNLSQLKEVEPQQPELQTDHWLSLNNLELKFHTPFLVYQAADKTSNNNCPDGIPLRNHQGQGILPASSLHGALRSQAERILRTIGQKTPHGYATPAIENVGDAAKTDLASVLFGAPGWQSLIRLTDYVVQGEEKTLTHEIVAIDRLTGGGKDSAKFNIEAFDCPKLLGKLSINLHRLKQLEAHNPGVTQKALGLLAHVLRDLDEGDISLGYGASKGYGKSQSNTAQKLQQALDNNETIPVFAECLNLFATLANDATPLETGDGQAQSPDSAEPQASNGDFHNPYVFIPFPGPTSDDKKNQWKKYQDIPADEDGHYHQHLSHSRYAPDALSGRLVCHLKNTTPFFIGAGDVPNTQDPKQKRPFKLDDKLALPATSLRGMLSSLHESITQSRMRVMGDGRYSMRTATDQYYYDDNGEKVHIEEAIKPISAVGKVIKIGDTFWLQMLALPTMEVINNEVVVEKGYRKLMPDTGTNASAGYLPLKSLIGNNTKSLIDDHPTHTAQNPSYRYMRTPAADSYDFVIGSDDVKIRFRGKQAEKEFHFKEFRRRKYILGIRRKQDELPLLPADARERSQKETSNYSPGLIRTMANNNRKLFDKRKHELFLPMSANQLNLVSNLKQAFKVEAIADIVPDETVSQILTDTFFLLPISEKAIDRFNRLADEMTRSQDNDPGIDSLATLPYHPNHTERNTGGVTPESGLKHHERALRLKHGDLVYFRPNGTSTEIEEIAFSSIWRKEIDREISDWVGPDLAPLNTENEQPLLSPTELAFGFVETAPAKTRQQQQDAEKAIRSMASRIRIGFGSAIGTPTQASGDVTLKILSSPNNPPELCFESTRGTQGYISKSQLAQSPDNYQRKGRKYYLHALRQGKEFQNLTKKGQPGSNTPPWKTHHEEESKNQKVRIRPIQQGHFVFEIDFINLKPEELEALCATLSPHSKFEHKLGMGKPIGLGSVKINMAGLYLVNRTARYQQTEFHNNSRYEQVWTESSDKQYPSHLEREQHSAATPDSPNPVYLAHSQMQRLKGQHPATFNAIVLSGNPEAITKPVHYPQLEGLDIEEKTYEWSMNNAKPTTSWNGQPQGMASFTTQSASLPSLSRKRRNKK